MSWIKVETTLYTKPETFLLAKELHISRAEAVGFLVVFWSWADKESTNGILRASREVIDAITMEHFASALTNVGWLDFTDDGQVAHLPNFDRHNGSSAKKRATTADRVRRHRNAKGVTTRNATSVSREEKIREKNKEKNKEKKGGWDGV